MLKLVSKHLRYKIIRLKIKKRTLNVELADSFFKRAIGLMYRAKISSKKGMLFLFNSEGKEGVWMKNMRFPIDIAWIGADKRIVYMLRNIPVCRSFTCKVYKPDSEAKYVLELKSGFLKGNSVKLGDRVHFKLD